MGRFDFERAIGRKIFDRETDANDQIKKEIEASLQGLKDLTVDYDASSGVVKLGGTATSSEALEKAMLIAGNVMGVGSVNIGSMKHPGESAGVQYYVIKSGDTLATIALQYYGDSSKYPKILEANREVIKDPNLIFLGQKIRIPPAE
jgi:nucleoid-associated protein YgaU